MFMIYPILLGIILGLVFGGNFRSLLKRRFSLPLIAVAAFVIQLLIFSNGPLSKIPSPFLVALHLLSYLLLLAFVYCNRKTAGILPIGSGIFLNSLVIFLNGGYMPTTAENLGKTSMAGRAEALAASGTVNNSVQTTADTLLPWLGDIFHTPSWLPFSNVFSIGDILIAIGILIYLVFNMKRPVV